jgi:hypothetical protein
MTSAAEPIDADISVVVFSSLSQRKQLRQGCRMQDCCDALIDSGTEN